MNVDERGRTAGAALRASVAVGPSERGLAAVARHARNRRRARAVQGSLGLVAIVLLSTTLLTRGDRVGFVDSSGAGAPTYYLSAPPPGETVAGVLPDGAPVFVVRHADATVTVLSAIDPHLEDLAVWCDAQRGFVEPIGAAAFDEYGRYVFGPAINGMHPYQASINEKGDVAVGRRLPPPARTVDATPTDTSGTCMQRGLGPDALRHDASQLPPMTTPSSEPGDGQVVRVAGVFSISANGEASLCTQEQAQSHAGRGCPPGSPEVASLFATHLTLHDLQGTATGTFIARHLPDGRYAEVAGPMGGQHIPLRTPRPELVGSISGSLAEVDLSGEAALIFTMPVAPSDGTTPIEPAKSRWPVRSDTQVFDPADANPSSVITLPDLARNVLTGGPLRVTAEVNENGEVEGVTVERDF